MTYGRWERTGNEKVEHVYIRWELQYLTGRTECSEKETTTHVDLPGTAALEVLGAAVVLPRSIVDVRSAAVVVSGPVKSFLEQVMLTQDILHFKLT